MKEEEVGGWAMVDEKVTVCKKKQLSTGAMKK